MLPDHTTEQEKVRAREAAYRRGWMQGVAEGCELVLSLIKEGYQPAVVGQLVDTYLDHDVHAWRYEHDLCQCESPPLFDPERIHQLLSQAPSHDQEK